MKSGQTASATRSSPPYLLRIHPFLQCRILSFLSLEELKPIYALYPILKARFLMQPANGGRGSGRGRGRGQRPKNNRPLRLVAPAIADPHTLLARLNARRLYRRVQYFKSQQNACTQRPYPLGKTTEQIAVQEWHDCVNGTKQPVALPSRYELLLFSQCPRAVAVLASYPRSGNSLLRTLFEKATLRVTGSDMRGGLTKHDLVGEAATTANMVQFVKTHYPERRGQFQYKACRAVLLVRNPYDAIYSYFNLMMTGQHTTNMTEEMRTKHDVLWKEMVLKEIAVWKAFHEYWLSQDIPLLVIRYEDLIRYTDQVLANVVEFVLEVKDMRFFKKRIENFIKDEQIEQLGSYRPRSGGIGKSVSIYSPELLQQMNIGIFGTMEKLGYAEMLVPKPEEWKLDPLDRCGVEIDGTQETITVNGDGGVRRHETFTDWRKVRAKLSLGNNACKCPKCTGKQ